MHSFYEYKKGGFLVENIYREKATMLVKNKSEQIITFEIRGNVQREEIIRLAVSYVEN